MPPPGFLSVDEILFKEDEEEVTVVVEGGAETGKGSETVGDRSLAGLEPLFTVPDGIVEVGEAEV